MSDNAPPTKARRFLRLARLTASVSTDYATTRLRTLVAGDGARDVWSQAHTRSGEKIAETLGDLKGAVMKIGQMASISNDLLPEEFTSALQSLQREAPPMPFEAIARQIESELGDHPLRLFRDIDEKPFASASIGQVHRAITDDGRDVVIKVQYPGVDASVDSDIRNLKFALRASGFVNANRRAFDALFDEIRDRLIEELDYCLEADNVRRFRKNHANDDFVIVPDVVAERSAQRVLTLTYEPGDSLESLQTEPYTQQVRDQIGENLFHLYGRQLFRDQLLHGDPHPGNFAFRPDGRVVLYDYGCTKAIPKRYLQIYHQVVEAALDDRFDDFDPLMFALGARVEGSEPVPDEFYQRWCEVLFSQVKEEPVFDYRDSRHHEEIRTLIPLSLKHIRSFQPPAEVMVVNRVTTGLHNLFRKLGPRVRWLELLTHYARMGAESSG